MSTKILVTSEIAGGLINGSNKVFTTSKAITNINEILVNGSAYAQYSFVGNTITLDDAPSTGTVLVTYSYDINYDYLDNTGWIVGEVMNGKSDGINKVFTSFYPISFVDEVRVNGISVGSYSILGNSILLSSAPATSQTVEIDYFRKDLTIVDYNRDLYYTKKEVRDLVYADISQDDTSVQYPKALVDNAIQDGVSEVMTQMTDKSRYVIYNINSEGYIIVTPKTDSISTFDIVNINPIPHRGRLLNKNNGSIIEYTGINSNKVLSASFIDYQISETTEYYVGYQLPRNCKRIVSIYYNGIPTQDSGDINAFLSGIGMYFINNGFIYLKNKAFYTIEVELNEYINYSDDNSLIYVDKEDIGVVVYYALRQLYSSRESDKLQTTSQLYMDKLASYKRRMIKKRSNNKNNKMRTNNLLTN